MNRSPRCRRLWIFAGFAVAALATCARAQTAAPTADQVKAAYLHKFAGYVDWPAKAVPETTAPFVIGVVGGDGVAGELARLAAGRTAQGRPLELRRLPPSAPPSDGVQMLFVGRDVGADATAALLAAWRSRPVLTVTDAARGLELGAMLNFVEVDHRVRFEAAPSAAEGAGLRLSSRLLAVAERVTGGGP